jgi:hypothetical protein
MVVSRNLPGGTKKSHENLSEDSQSQVPDLNPRPPEYEAEVLTTNNSPDDISGRYKMKVGGLQLCSFHANCNRVVSDLTKTS